MRRVLAAFAVAAGFAALTSCSTSDGAAPAAVATPVVSPSAGVGSAPELSAEQISDTGLPSHVGDGKLTTSQVKRLMQFFEDKVSEAYAHGDANALDHYLAGPMLSGNRATINLLNSQGKYNVFRIRVGKVTIETNEKNSVIFDMTGDMVLDYFVDSKTHQVLENGLPGPSQVQFAVFFNENPKTHTWYWTGEQSEANSSGGAGQ
jgi:hypothetical protein